MQITPEMATNELQRRNMAQINPQLLSMVTNVLIGAGGLGAALRGGKGLYNVVRRNVAQPDSMDHTLMVPVPVERRKRAETSDTKYDRYLRQLEARREPPPAAAGGKRSSFTNFLLGGNAKDLGEHPLANAAAITAGMGGLYGGYKLTDWLLDQQRRRSLSRERDAAKAKYEAALQALVQKPRAVGGGLNKAASADPLDQLCDRAEKQAWSGGQVANVALATWPPLFLAGFLLSHGLTSSRGKHKLLQKAVSQRQQRQLLSEPVYAFPDYDKPPSRRPLKRPPSTAATVMEEGQQQAA